MTPNPDVVVSSTSVEQVIEQYVESEQSYHVSVSCGSEEIVVPFEEIKQIECSVTNLESKEQFEATTRLHVKDTKVQVGTIILSNEISTEEPADSPEPN